MIIDSCGWLELLADGPLADRYAAYFASAEEIVTPALVLYEVYKKIKREKGEENALLVVGQMNATRVVPLTASLALLAGDVSLKYGLPMADAFIYATALTEKCRVITGDKHFKGLDRVVFIE